MSDENQEAPTTDTPVTEPTTSTQTAAPTADPQAPDAPDKGDKAERSFDSQLTAEEHERLLSHAAWLERLAVKLPEADGARAEQKAAALSVAKTFGEAVSAIQIAVAGEEEALTI